MSDLIQNHLGLAIGLLGGTGAIIAAALKGVKPVVKWGIEKALSKPSWNHILLEYRVDIEAFFDEVDQAAKEALDSAAQKPSA